MADFSPKLAGADAARLLQATLDELSAIKKSIAQPFQSKANLEAQLARLEGGIRQKANVSAHACSTLLRKLTYRLVLLICRSF